MEDDWSLHLGVLQQWWSKDNILPFLLLQPLLPSTQTSSVPPSLGSIIGRKGDPSGVESAISTGRRLEFSLICFLIFVYLLVSMSPGLICVLLEGALHARIFSRVAFLLLTEAAAGDVMGGECSPSAGLSCDANTSLAEPSLSMWCLS